MEQLSESGTVMPLSHRQWFYAAVPAGERSKRELTKREAKLSKRDSTGPAAEPSPRERAPCRG